MTSHAAISSWGRRSVARIALTALTVAAGYYLGANLGFILRLPPATPSVMWPPNAILTATLLLAPPRRWAIYLLAAFPAHLVAELGVGWSSSLVLALFMTNCSEALIAAIVVRRLSDAPGRFDTLKRVVAFVVGAVLLAPLVSSFLDAGVVATFGEESYWTVWRTRLFANALTELTLVPALVIVITAARPWLRHAPGRRQLEAATLGLGLVIASVAGFGMSGHGHTTEVPRSPLALLLPFLLWAAVRFGPGGASLSLLITALAAISAVTHRPAVPGRLEVVGLQIFLTVIAVPLMCLAALIEERRRAEEALGERLRFEALLSRLSGAFVHLPSHEMDAAFETWMQHVGEFLRLDRLVLLHVSGPGGLMTAGCCWTSPGAPPPQHAIRGALAAGATSWRWLPRDEPRLDHPGRLPRSDGDAAMTATGYADLIPLVAGERVLGGLVFEAITLPRMREAILPGLRLVAEVFAGALARKETEDALRASELMKSAILESISTGVAVLDRDGCIVVVNGTWERLTHENGGTWDAGAGVGANYLETCRHAAREGLPHAGEALAGIEAVLARSQTAFVFDYAYGTPPADRWFAMTVVPLDRPEGGAVISHADVTERKRVEIEAQRSRQELAHFTRVSTMGELTASLAHELNQPLAGILTNAQAAQRLLVADVPDLEEVGAILSDIVDDDKRAGEMIKRLRELMRKGDSVRVSIDLNALIRDVTKLLASDAVIRNISVELELDARPFAVVGDRVQLQQVILNLLLNAMDAVAERDGVDRTIVLRTEVTELDAVHVAVQDAGPGLGHDTERQIFEPFYTTKPAGMGMGLSIARSIVQAHGGFIWATNNPRRGATFHLALPLNGVRSP